jgi:hypothetical protein
MKNIYVIITALILITATSFGQSFNKEIKFDGKSDAKEYAMKVAKGLKLLDFVLKSKITDGYIFIELIDPNNIIKGRFAVFSKKKTYALEPHKLKKTKFDFYKAIKENKNLKYDKGELKKIIHNPFQGNWIIKVKSDKAKGTVKIMTKEK